MNHLFSTIMLYNPSTSSEKERGHLFLCIHVNKVSPYASSVLCGFDEIQLIFI